MSNPNDSEKPKAKPAKKNAAPRKNARAKKAAPRKVAKKKTAPKRGRGRPSLYTEALGAEICRRLYESEEGEIPESLRAICRDPKMPSLSAVSKWLTEKREFMARYAGARELRKGAILERLHKLAREALSKAYGEAGTGEAGARIQAVKIEIDLLKWILGKEYSHDYGDKIKQELTGANGGPLQQQTAVKITPEVEEQIARIADISNGMIGPNK